MLFAPFPFARASESWAEGFDWPEERILRGSTEGAAAVELVALPRAKVEPGPLREPARQLPLAAAAACCRRGERRTRRCLLEDYRLQPQVLGTGACGSVRLAICRRTGRRAAVKSFELAGTRWIDAQNEAKIHLALDHPNIAQLRQVYDERDAMHIVMECLEGGELFSRLVGRKRFSEAEAAEAARQVLYAVSYLHSHDVVHCDIKLENLLYERKDSQHLKLVDFGFAQRCKGRDRLSRRCGTSCYMAPEVFGGSYGAEADIWSVGVVVYMLLVGKPPYAGRDQAVRAKAAKGKLDFAPSFFKLSEGARAFLQSLLAVDPTQRLTADMALRHPWIRGHAPDKAGASTSVLQSLNSFAGVCPALRASLLPEAQSLPNEDQVPFREEFRALDPGGRGALKGEDLRRALGEEREEEAEKVFAALDIDGDGEVTWSEFLAATMPQQVLASERMARPPVHLLGLRRSFGVLSKWQDSLKGLYAVSAGVHEWCPWNLDGP